ncbi:MAG: hypothetical protein NTU73_09360 [Ignavibacteriae bacterium]|nr:hypothetical protein [Ignavibacteriota bacterium]
MKKNKFNKLNDIAKVKLVNEFCKHLISGFSEYSFVECDYKDIEKYAQELDNQNDNLYYVEKIGRASRESFLYWEKLGIEMFEKNDKKYFFPVWIFYVKSRFKWGEKNKSKSQSQSKEKIIEIDLSLDNEK